jgi:iron complex transport system ATP-binding protein
VSTDTHHRLHSEEVSLRYPGTDATVVTASTLRVEDGQITTIIGPNGCGKSTLLRALGRLLRPETGSVVLDGELIHHLPSKEVARRLGLLGQQPQAPQGITVQDLVYRGRYPHLGFFSAPASHDNAAVENALELAGVQDLRRRPVDSLSGGQRQRAWIAMAIAQDTDLLLLDEPTTFLDLAHQLEVMDLVTTLNQQGKTLLLVLHDINQAVAVSDQIVAMKDGQIMGSGAPQDVINRDLLTDLYQVDCDIFDHPVAGHPVCLPYGDELADQESADWESGVEIRDLGTGYGSSSYVSHDLRLTFPKGAITALVGPNGCGKSTLLRTGARLLKPLDGAVLIDGVDAREGSRRSLARRLSILMQGPKPPSGFVVEDVVAAGRTPHQSILRRWADDEEAIGRAVETCGLGDLRYREFETLSGGQRQRAWIAMALAQDSPILFLDEPTTFLDIGYQVEVLDLVHRLNRSRGHTVVMVLHDLNLAARYSDHIVAMKDGEIMAAGRPSSVVTEDLARDVFGVESRVIPDPRTGRPIVLPTAVTSSQIAGERSIDAPNGARARRSDRHEVRTTAL